MGITPLPPSAISHLVAALLAVAPPASRQDPAPPEAAPPQDASAPADEEASDSLPLEQGGTTVVVATRRPEDPFDIPRSVNVIDERRLLERGARTAAEALRYQPGIWVQKTGHVGGAPIIRGFMGNQVIYLFDGVRRNTASLFAGPNSYLQTVDELDIDRIEVVRGPGSVLYGSDAIGGAIDVTTNELPLFPVEAETGLRSYSRVASADRELSSRLEGYVAGPELFVAVGGTYRSIDDLEGGRGVGLQEPSSWRERNWDAQVDWLVDPDSTLELFFQDYSRPRATRYDRPDQISTADRELLGLRYESHDLPFAERVELTLYHQDQRDTLDATFFDSLAEDRTIGFDAQATSDVSDTVSVTWGVHVHRDESESSDPQSGTADPDVEWINPAVFALTQWQASERLRFDLGLRWDSFALESDSPGFANLPAEIQDAILNGAFSEDDLELDQDDDALTGGLGAVYSLTEETNVFAHVGRAFRAPNKSDLLSYGQFTFGFEVPTPDVEPESSWTYELGVRHEERDFAAELVGFYTEVDDAIVNEPGTFNGESFIDVNGNGIEDPAEQVFLNTNSSGTVRAYGAELTARQYLPRDWVDGLVGENEVSCYGNASWIYGEDTGTDEPLDRAYPANLVFGVRLEDSRVVAERDWWVELETWWVRHFDRIPSTRLGDPAFLNDPQDASSGLLGGDGTVPGFALFNLRGGLRVTANATLYLGLENFTDEDYRVKDSRIDGPGINFIVGLDVAF